ncbi:phenylacetate--CoA ligase family protein [Thioalkalivibrio sp. AKL6]|uniref:phenylacetate--CoA ligase family protein n=1 Tax=Thioalkalivibrio sp. AKL6 TaxID=1158154 RepID=UPI00035C391D|nr:phenylacetate--CoA ligase family protein [Thioalkalivibrio sp. AKL6]
MGLYTQWVARGLFPLQERLKGHPTVAWHKALEATQWWTPEALQSLQEQRLQGLLERVARQVPFYREWFAQQAWSPAAFSGIADLQRLPVVDKALIREQGAAWRAEGARNLEEQHTSGSSGEPLRFWLGADRIGMDIAAKWRATRWWGVDVGDRELVLWGSAVENEAQNGMRAWRDRLFRSYLVPARDLNPARLDRIIEQIRQRRPRMLFGYPSALSRVAWRARERGQRLDDLGIRVAFTTSEVLRPEWREVIGEMMGCGVANEYGARDAGFIARECPAGGMHITAEALIVEILDAEDRPVPPGATGNIVITNLVGPEFPFIRYRTGDRGALDPRPCPCGRGLPLLRDIDGRANDGLIATDGSWIHGSRFNYLMRDLPGLRAYKVIQHDRHHVEVLLSLVAALPAAAEGRLRRALVDALGQAIQVDVRAVDAIPPEPNGKHRHVVCRVPDADQPAPNA